MPMAFTQSISKKTLNSEIEKAVKTQNVSGPRTPLPCVPTATATPLFSSRLLCLTSLPIACCPSNIQPLSISLEDLRQKYVVFLCGAGSYTAHRFPVTLQGRRATLFLDESQGFYLADSEDGVRCKGTLVALKRVADGPSCTGNEHLSPNDLALCSSFLKLPADADTHEYKRRPLP
jgi:hypothetical protein